jgi:hypothetical protein
MLMGAVVSVAVRALSDPRVAVVYAGIVLGIALLRSAYGALRTRSAGFLLFATYGFIHLGLLIPARLHSIATIGRTHWGTRGMHRTAESTDPRPTRVLEARPAATVPAQRTSSSTVMFVEDTRAAKNVIIEPGATSLPADILPSLERGPLGRWRPVKTAASTVVMVPHQRTSTPRAEIDWSPRAVPELAV